MNPPDRPSDVEIMDQGPDAYTAEEFQHCLHQLKRIGRYLGAENTTLRALHAAVPHPNSILDVGCGGGHFTARLAATFPQAQVVGIDCNRAAVTFAREQHQQPHLAYRWVEQKELEGAENSVDVVTATLVCHHMSNRELVHFISRARSLARHAVVLNDLHRHPIALAAFFVFSRVFFRNRLIIADGQLSIRKAFKRADWTYFLKEAGVSEDQATIHWRWPFRWVVVVQAQP